MSRPHPSLFVFARTPRTEHRPGPKDRPSVRASENYSFERRLHNGCAKLRRSEPITQQDKECPVIRMRPFPVLDEYVKLDLARAGDPNG